MRNRIILGLFILIAVCAVRVYLHEDLADAPVALDGARRAVASDDSTASPTAPPAVLPKTPAHAPAPRPATKVRSRADLLPEDLLARKPRRSNGPRGAEDPRANPMDRYRDLKMSGDKTFGHRGYRVLAARAIRPERYSSSLGPILFEEFGRRVVADAGPGWGDLRTNGDGQPLLVNPANGRLALVTGTIEVSIATVEAAEALATEENLTLVNYDRTIGLAFLKAPADFSLVPALERIAARPGVAGVDLELVESRKVAQ